MKFFKNFLVVVLIICLACFTNVTIFAKDNIIQSTTKEMAQRLLASAINDSDLPYGTYSISEAIPTYLLSNSRISEYKDVQHYIVYCNSSPICNFVVNGANTSSPTYSLYSDFAQELNDSILSKDLTYSFIVTENQIFVLTDNEALELKNYDKGSYATNNSLSKLNNSYVKPSAVLNSVKNIKNLKQTDSKELVTLSTDSRSSIKSIGAKGIGLRYIGEVSGTVPSYTQSSGSNYCWAASAWCVGETLNPLGKTVTQCVSYAGGSFGSGGGYDKQLKILKEIYGLTDSKYYSSQLSQSEITSFIDDDYPFILLCFKNKNTSSLGHSVTCYKYDDSYTPVRIKVMDSLYSGSWVWMTNPSSGTDYKITSAGTTYTYTNTITPVAK